MRLPSDVRRIAAARLLAVAMAGPLAAPALLALPAAPAAADEGFARLEGHGGPVSAVAVSPGGRTVLTAGFDYSVGLWSLGDARLLRWLEGHRAAVDAVAYLPDGGRALSAGDDFRLILWDLDAGTPLATFEGHRGRIAAIAVAPDGRLAATAGWDGRVGLWDLAGERPVRWLEAEGPVNDVVFSGDGRRLYTAGKDGTIAVWEVASGGLVRTLVRHGFSVNRLALDEAAGWLAYGTADGVVRALDLATGAEVADLSAGRRPILALEPGPDGRRLAVGDGQGYVTIIETRGWRVERDFHAAARGPIWALAWTPDGKRLVSGGTDDSAAVWPIGASAEAVEGVLAAADGTARDPAEMTNGERQFARTCAVCHTLTPDGGRRAGPTLWGLFGRPAGGAPGYRYSPALAGSDIVWNAETIDRLFREGPESYTPGSKMPLQRITGEKNRRDLIDFLAEHTGPKRSAAQRGE